MRMLRELQSNRPLQTAVKAAAVSATFLLAAVLVGTIGITMLRHIRHASWAGTTTTTYSYVSGGRTITVTTTTDTETYPAGVAAPATPAPVDNTGDTPIAAVKLGLNDPATNVSPTADFANACYTNAPSSTCDTIALSNINRARAAEGLGPMILPADYESLSPNQQIFVVTNLERTARGLAAAKGPDPTLSSLALSGADYNTDPNGPDGYSWAGNWAGGESGALAADFSWMYDDGPGSYNIDCSASNPGGCWGHRHNILINWPNLTMGTASANVGDWTSMAQLFVQNW